MRTLPQGEKAVESCDLVALIMHARAVGASDLHCSSGLTPFLRIDGDLRACSGVGIIDSDELMQQLSTLLGSRPLELLQAEQQLDCAFEIPSAGRFRINAFRHSRGWSVVARIVPMFVPSIEDLTLPKVLSSVTQVTHGLVLVTGPTGSGKSTTLASIVSQCNRLGGGHIVTIEDPIEYVYTSQQALIHQREVGGHVSSFAAALRAALREDPDVILVGELRDLETTSLALTAAETGHLVLASLHASSAPGALERIIDMFPGSQQRQVRSVLAETVQLVVAQNLIRKLGGGRVPLAEVLVATPAVRNLIREAKTHQLPGLMQTSQGVGMQTRERSYQELMRLGYIDSENPL